MDGWMDGWIGR